MPVSGTTRCASPFVVRGWCPSAWRPLESGDGLIVRLRPPLARLTRAQALGLCELALGHGSGTLDLTSRGNLQLRGVRETTLRPLLEGLVALGLVDGDAEREARRNLTLAPDWSEGDETEGIARAFMDRLDRLPPLPGKVGFAIDAGSQPVLGLVPADFRIERGETGALILRAEGRETGVPVDMDGAAEALIDLAHWFVDSGGAGSGRMVRHHAELPAWAQGAVRPAAPRGPLAPGLHPLGAAFGVAFGSLHAEALAELLDKTEARAVRLTPWRVLLLENAALVPAVGFATEASDPSLRADACPGMPACPQASVETRPVAERLAPHVAGRLHVSGCAKGCARSLPAAVTLTGRGGTFDLSFETRAGAPPVIAGLQPHQILTHFGAD
ncbi:cobalamin biosynthesis protein CobG [Novosphingobium clariflavum]|uniref:Cobalamin biosynthesis protein CobG n=1 Tax=Novosphingobium clariflavum TaxID=2029884 RepID=A0ABV6S5K1_9SPHN|nr:cobalamin biosynthesis protein CobG [Novosphingobium clariflavum]